LMKTDNYSCHYTCIVFTAGLMKTGNCSCQYTCIVFPVVLMKTIVLVKF